MRIHDFAKKLFTAWLALFFLSTPLLGANIAHAQGAPVFDAQQFAIWVKDSVKYFLQSTMQAAVATALVNTVSFTADRLAYDAAVRIATGGPAEQPLYDGTPERTYLGQLGADIAGEAIGSLSDTIEGAGGLLSNFNLCAPSSPYTLIQFKLGIKGVYKRPEPKCDFNKMFGPEGTWNSFIADLTDKSDGEKNQLILKELANMYDPQKAEFGAGLQLSTDIFGETTLLPFIGVQKKLQDNGFKDVVNAITQKVETPASILEKQVEESQDASTKVREQATFAMLTNKDLLLSLGVHAGSVFSNTLLSKVQERIWQGMFDFDTTQVDPFDPESFALDTTEDAAQRYRSLLAFSPLQISNYSILSDFITCPGSDSRGLYNCVADANFISAVARADAGAPLTVAEAIDEGLLDGSWPLIPAADVARNQDAFCYTYGFCYGNLVKLRKARVISIGWELAANATANPVEDPATLQEVMDGFTSCGPDGLPDDNHPWCKMIDPDWVLKYPDTQCRMQTYGETLLTDKADERAQSCVDMPSCIAQDENGNCVGGYGYCVAEENTWRFRGESCPEYAASCLAFEDSEGTSTALLKNTVDPGPCTEDTVGCRWYATQKEEQEDGTYAYAAIDSIADADADTAKYADRIYFNSQVEECDEENGGCSTLIERDTDLRLNTVHNPSFEQDDDTDEEPDGWYNLHTTDTSWSSTISTDGSYAREGEVAVSPGESDGSGALYQPGIELGQARTYTLSFYARQRDDGDSASATVSLDLYDETGTGIDIEGLAITGNCDDSYTNLAGSAVTTGVGIEDMQPASSDYERFSCTFTVPPLSDSSLRIFGDLTLHPFNGYIDSVQLEQGEDVSSPVEGYNDTNYSTVVVKVAPTYLGCTGSEDDPAECANYAQVCSEQDMGCTMYTPTNGDPDISGIATELDTCPAECSGYDTYRQEATLYEPDGVDSVYFIPDTATECSAEQVGCDEFTNLTSEEQEYYSFMRACVTQAQADANVSSDNGATYYTWEGSDEDGYQLRTWKLLQSNLGSSDYTHTGTDGVTDTAPDQAPCSSWIANDDGITCADETDDDGDSVYDWDSEDCNARADIFTNPDCREFYDENGNIHYRNWQQTVTVNDACQAYRKTTIAGDTAADQEATCEDSGGYYVSDSGECRYYGYSEESTSCEEAANGCRAYAGGRSRNSRLVFEDLFEDGTLNSWDAESASDATYSNESLAADGHSMLLTGPVTSFIVDNGSACTDASGCDGTSRSFGGECTISEESTYCGTLDNELFAGKTYTVSVVAKGTGTLQLGFDFNADPAAPEIDIAFDDAVELDDGWQVLNLGPLIMDADTYPDFGDGTTLVLIPTGSAYVDNVVLREGEESLNVIRDSWVTPASCDQSLTGETSPQYYLGCQEYTTQEGDTAYLKSFSSLCDEDKVGCAAFFKTQESESTSAKTYHATCNNLDIDGDGLPDIATSATACYYFTFSDTSFDTDSAYLCTISAGESSCLFTQDGFTPAWDMDNTAVSYGPETTVVPADQDMFLVVNDAVTCDDDVAGCMELGDPEWSQDRNSTEGADSVYLMNLPDTYDDILCAHDELFCDAFTTNEAETFYFKHPLNQTCEYRTDVTVDGTAYTGWFRTETDDFCYGTCEDTLGNEGDACGSNADCASDETCNAENPSYVIGGTESGIWNNGDDGFTGWAGTCSATYDTCTEFQDKLAQDDGELYGATDGTSYFYLNNDSLSEYGLSDSQKCDGQVSLKNGCAMFYDTGDTSLSANASATEVASRHADTLFGTEAYGLVDPIDCENAGDTTITTASGDTIDLCATRCVYDYGEVYDLSDGATYKEKLTDERTSSRDYDRDDLYTFGGSCYDATDCPLVQSESGANIEAISCATQVRVDPFSATASFGGAFSEWRSGSAETGFSSVPRQENDTNSVLKVNRDRSCSEWLSCSSTNTQWDATTASFVTTCGDIALCKDYDATTGSSFCSDWDFEKPEVIYDTDWYASRDTSWYGNEYSGMAIPNLFPVQALTQADVSPIGYCDFNGDLRGTCDDVDAGCGPAGAGTCLSPDDAVAAGIVEAKDYALVLNAGTCSEDEGESCSVGYCEENGAACATSDQCSDGACIVGSCYDVSSTACQTAADCSEGQTCYGGACADVGDDVEIEDYDSATGDATTCDSSETFVADAAMKLGSCVNSQCLLTPNGETYTDGTTEGKICRAYPESNSPFPNEVVESWYEPANPGSVESDPQGDALPYSLLSGFENTTTCAYGEDCDCSYTKVTFGDGQDSRVYGKDWDADFSVCGGDLETYADAGTICTIDANCSSDTCVDVNGQLGLCESGDREGGYCTENEQCGEGGTCAKTTREDVMYGLNGFCLEKDTSTNILGDRNKKACISWLPVDELAGDTDLQAKYTGAGYFEDTYACVNSDFYVDLGTSNVPEDTGSYDNNDIACAESDWDGDLTRGKSYTSETISACGDNAVCPDGYWTLLGQAAWEDGLGHMADACTGDSSLEVNDCPYVCIPLGAYADGGSCDPDGAYTEAMLEAYSSAFDYESVLPENSFAVGRQPSDGDDAAADGFAQFDNMATALKSCRAQGVEYTDELAANVFNIDSGDYAGDSYGNYRYLHFQEDTSFENVSCKNVLQVSDATNYAGYAFTDRILNPNSTFTNINDADYPNMEYSADTVPTPFGFITTNPGTRDASETPLQVAACEDGDGNLVPPNGTDNLNSCDGDFIEYAPDAYENFTAPATALARSFIDFTLKLYKVGFSVDEVWSVSPTSGATASVFSRVNQLFAAADIGIHDTLYSWNAAWGSAGLSADRYGADDADAYTTYDVRPAEGTAPQVWSVDVGSCSDDGVLCEEGTEEAITLNSQDTGDQSGVQFFNATIKFYAAADKNQLPIRRVMVDWGDDVDGGSFTGSDADDNFFKNARGLQEGTQNSKCDLETEWGLTDESCDPYYFTYNHIYTCSSEILRDSSAACSDSPADGDDDYDSFPCWVDQSGDDVPDACVFKPRIHIRDNWGWCTGTCEDGNIADEDGRSGCFAGVGNDIQSASDETYSECSYAIYPDDNSDIDPWVEYSGVIIVTP